MTKITWISDSARCAHVGQSGVARECLTRLQLLGYEVDELGFADSEVQSPLTLPFNVVPCLRSDMYDANKVVSLLEQTKPDVVIMSHDPWQLPTLNEVKQRLPHIKYIGYITVDGEPAYYGWRNFLKPYDKLIAPTPFTKNTLLDRWMDLNIDVVPYGINHVVFHPPKQGKEQLKTELTQKHIGHLGINLHQKFVGIYVGANQDRKNLGLIHEAWREFEKGKEYSVALLMFVHSASLKEETGSYDLSVFLQDTQTIKLIHIPQPVEIIGQFMAASDVLLHPCAGEGFGLTVAEAMACGTVPVTIPYAAVGDYCNPTNAYCVPYTLHTGGYHVHRAFSDVKSTVPLLNQAATNVEERIVKANNAIGVARNFTWDNCATGLQRNIEEVLTMTRETLYFTKVN